MGTKHFNTGFKLFIISMPFNSLLRELACPLVVLTHNYCRLFTYFLCLPLDLHMNTTVFIVWAMHSTTDSNSGLTAKHTSKGFSGRQYNLIAEAMAAAMTPTTTTMMMPSTSIVSTPQPTGNDRCQYKQYSPGFY